MRRKRKLYLSIFDYSKHVVCDLYDNNTDISGQAFDVNITKERNGWKELAFDIPSTCTTDEGEEENYRLKYLIAEYIIRSIDDKGEDWFIISEPKITRNGFSKNVSVRAPHISQLLKHKNLDLELSDDEGNNVGTAEVLLATILEGTDWNVGNVGVKYKKPNGEWDWHTFLEEDGSAKQRTITAEAGTGALSLIEKLCDVFEAKPVYYIGEDERKMVDIIPMNPFAHIEPEQIPKQILKDELNVLELYYDRNVHDLEKTTNTENMATRLYAYGSSGDMNGACTLQTAEHLEWTFVVDVKAEEYRFNIGTDINPVYRYFSGDVSVGDTIIWSNLDLTSRSYIYNETKEYAYHVYNSPNGQFHSLSDVEPSPVLNEFSYLLALNYYDNVGLMSEEQFQDIALFQRIMPEYYRIIQEKSKEFIQGEATLSKLAEHATGMLKLRLLSKDGDKYIIDTIGPDIEHPDENHGVIYRTDYEKAERRYFQWHITDRLTEYGYPVTGTPSVLFVVHDTDPVTYDTAYLKKIWDAKNGEVVDENGIPKDFEYSAGNYPVAFTTWNNDLRLNLATDRVYLFCSDSMQGLLGSRISQMEAVYQNLDSVTMKHPVVFHDADAYPVPLKPSTNPEYQWPEYQWMYAYHAVEDGTLYFNWHDKYGEENWFEVHISDEPPTSEEENGYFFNSRRKTLHRWTGSEWYKIEDKQITVKMFESVIYYCKRRDELYRGIYEYYFRVGGLPVGNYAIFDGYNAYWTFKMKEPNMETFSYEDQTTHQSVTREPNIVLDYSNGAVFTNAETDDEDNLILNENGKPTIHGELTCSTLSAESRSVIFPTDNELADRLFYPGSIYTDGTEQRADTIYYRTSYIPVNVDLYSYLLPPDSTIYFYDENYDYQRYIYISDTSEHPSLRAGTFNVTDSSYIRLVVPNTSTVQYIIEGPVTIVDIMDDAEIERLTSESNNILNDRPFVYGSMDSNGRDSNVDSYRTYSIPAYENTTYEYFLPAKSRVFYYDINLRFISFDSLTDGEASGTFVTPPNTSYMRFVCGVNDLTNYYVHIQNYDKIFYKDREAYTILDHIKDYGEIIGITPLVKKFADVADDTYSECLPALLDAQEAAKTQENSLASELGDMLKDGRWQDSNYIKGDEKRLYDDAMYMHKQISMPEVEYSFTYLNMFGNQNERYYETHDFEWPDVDIEQVAHLVDMESKTNCWAYIDKVVKWYKQDWKTTVAIDTKLTLASRHGFTDVIARIAEVAKQIKAKQSLYDQAVSGRIDGSRIEGMISTNQVYLNGGASNWYNDDKGNLIFESADGLSAVQIGGRGIGISSEKLPDGSWQWRTALTGYGASADVMTTGLLSADRIDAGSITLDKLSSNVGKELEIGSNAALLLFATEDGSRPAGSLKTTDGFIEIRAGVGEIPAKINIVSGGELNLNGGSVNVYSKGEMNVDSGGRFVLKSQGATSMDSTENGLFIDSEQGVNFAGGRFKVEAHGDTMDVTVKADYIELGQANEAQIVMDAVHKTITVNALKDILIHSDSTIALDGGKMMNLFTDGEIHLGKRGHTFTISADSLGGAGDNEDRAYIYYNLPKYKSDISQLGGKGLYLGTDGFALKQKDATTGVVTSLVAADGKVSLVAGSDIIDNQDYVAVSVEGDYRIWAGHPYPESAPFSVKKDGTIFADNGTIGGFTMTGTQFHTIDNVLVKAYEDNTPLYIKPGLLDPDEEELSANEQVRVVSFDNTWYKICEGNDDYKYKFVKKTDVVIVSETEAGYVAIDNDTTLTNPYLPYNPISNGYVHPYAVWSGSKNPDSAPFSIKKDGTMYSVKGLIGGFTITNNQLHAGSGTRFVALNSQDSEDYAIWAGAELSVDTSVSPTRYAPYRVHRDGTVYMSNAIIQGGSILIQKIRDGVVENTFSVDNDGNMTAESGYIAGWTIDKRSLRWVENGVSVVGLQRPQAADYPAIWAGANNNTGKDANFRVMKSGKLYARGVDIRGDSIFQGTSFEALNNSGSTAIKINGAKEKIYLGAGWGIDPNDIAGPWPIDADSPNTSAGGFVQINCNNNSNPRIQVGSGGKFRVYQDGSLYFNNQGPAINITSFSSSAIAGYDSNGNYISASFFSSSRLGVGENGSSVYPTYNSSPYTAAGSTDIYNTIYGRGDNAATAKGVALGSRVTGSKVWNATVTRNDNKTKTLMVDCSDPYDTGYDAGESAGYTDGYKRGWNACRASVLDSKSTGTYYSGTITTKYDAPTGGAQARSVIYPYYSHTIAFYDIPDPK